MKNIRLKEKREKFQKKRREERSRKQNGLLRISIPHHQMWLWEIFGFICFYYEILNWIFDYFLLSKSFLISFSSKPKRKREEKSKNFPQFLRNDSGDDDWYFKPFLLASCWKYWKQNNQWRKKPLVSVFVSDYKALTTRNHYNLIERDPNGCDRLSITSLDICTFFNWFKSI